MQKVILQKSKFVIQALAEDFLLLEVGDRVHPISYYEEKLQVSRGTIQNAMKYLREEKAIEMTGSGRLGAYVKDINYTKLQSYCMPETLLGIMPLSYAITSQGLATGLYKSLDKIDCSLVYTRGASIRLQMVLDGRCHFAICSQNSAEKAIQQGLPLKILFNFGQGTYLPDCVLVFRDPDKDHIEPYMKMGYDPQSSDQTDLVDTITKDIPNVQLVAVRPFHTLSAIRSGELDVGTWNIDELLLSPDLHYYRIPPELTKEISTAVLVVAAENTSISRILQKYIDVNTVAQIQRDVVNGRIFADF